MACSRRSGLGTILIYSDVVYAVHGDKREVLYFSYTADRYVRCQWKI